jgi:uncharacterized membrane protein YphA (DoxX/SURF4 family)
VGAGLLLPTRLHRLAALVLIGSIIPTTLGGHRFWEAEEPGMRELQQTQFLKNLGLLGGLILAAMDTEGRPDLAWRTRHAARHVAHRADEAATRVRLAAVSGIVGRRLAR